MPCGMAATLASRLRLFITAVNGGALRRIPVTLADCVRDSDSPWAFPDQWHWVLRDPICLLQPVPAKGRLRFVGVGAMSVRVSRIYWRRDDIDREEPVYTITVEGWHDAFRFADHLQRGQCEFADIGFRLERRMKKRTGAKAWKNFRSRFYGGGLR